MNSTISIEFAGNFRPPYIGMNTIIYWLFSIPQRRLYEACKNQLRTITNPKVVAEVASVALPVKLTASASSAELN